MSSRRFREAAAAAAAMLVLAAAGCRGVTEDSASAETMSERLANQARAIAELDAENARLRAEIEELGRENRRLREALDAAGGMTAPIVTPGSGGG